MSNPYGYMMKNNENLDLDKFNKNWQLISDEILNLAKKNQGNIEALLSLLRLLENLHKEIRDGLFQDALPDNRQALYALLKDIESAGGWPYIYRGRLKSLMTRLSEDDAINLLNPIVFDRESADYRENIRD